MNEPVYGIQNFVQQEKKILMHAAAVTMRGVHEPVERVLLRVIGYIQQAAYEGAKVVFFPEVILGHYHDVPVAADGPEVKAVSRCARETGVSVGEGFQGGFGGGERGGALLLKGRSGTCLLVSD